MYLVSLATARLLLAHFSRPVAQVLDGELFNLFSHDRDDGGKGLNNTAQPRCACGGIRQARTVRPSAQGRRATERTSIALRNDAHAQQKLLLRQRPPQPRQR